jgi:hypothetical protein
MTSGYRLQVTGCRTAGEREWWDNDRVSGTVFKDEEATMACRRFPAPWLFGPVFAMALPLAAQSASYHLEYATGPGQLTHVVLVNDSQQPIEAFHFASECNGHSGGIGSIDVFDGPGFSGSMRGADGRQSRIFGVEPGGSWAAGFGSTCSVQPPEKEGHVTSSETSNSETRFDAILFADGSYEGSGAVMRALKARRDGIVANVRYWNDRLKAADAGPPDLDAVTAEVRRRMDEEKIKLRRSYRVGIDQAETPMGAYWEGRLQVDQNLENWATAKSPRDGEPVETVAQIAQFFDEWNRKIENDAAMKKLDAELPPVSEAEARSDTVAGAH